MTSLYIVGGSVPSGVYGVIGGFNAPLDAAVGDLTGLTQLFLMNDGITGSLPSTLSLLTNLVTSRFSSNELTGVLPLSLSTLYAASSSNLDVSQNSALCGAIYAFPGIYTTGTNLGYPCPSPPGKIRDPC